jgi:aminoglycoside phosphotransferase family enzyme
LNTTGSSTASRAGHDDVVRALSRPGAYSVAVGEVEVRRTPLSVLFFAGERVYKMPRPVEYGGDIESVRLRCEEEVRLNRRMAPGLYLGILPVTLEGSGRIALDGGGPAVDWVVEMLRLPADRLLDAMLDRGAVGAEQIDRIAAALVRFHDRAMTGPAVNRYGLVGSVFARTSANLEGIDELLDLAGIDAATVEHQRRLARVFPYRCRDLFERRVAEWRIRDGHGDLRAARVCLLPQATHVFGRVLFDRSQRSADVASDLAALAVDFDLRGHTEGAERLVRAYAHLASDEDLLRLVSYYKFHRALVRARLELEASRDEALAVEERERATQESLGYLQLAVHYDLRGT